MLLLNPKYGHAIGISHSGDNNIIFSRPSFSPDCPSTLRKADFDTVPSLLLASHVIIPASSTFTLARRSLSPNVVELLELV